MQRVLYWSSDFYPLTQPTVSPEHWAVWQYHRADLDAGTVLAFRRSACPYPVFGVSLRGVDPAAKYLVEMIDESRRRQTSVVAGSLLASEWELRLSKKGASALVRYQRVRK